MTGTGFINAFRRNGPGAWSCGEGGHGDGRSVRRKHHAFPENSVGFWKNGALDFDFFGNSFDGKIRFGDGAKSVTGTSRASVLPFPASSSFPFLTSRSRFLEIASIARSRKLLFDVAQNHFVARARKHMRDAIAHCART